MYRTTTLATLLLVAIAATPASAEGGSSNEQIKAAALKLKQSSGSSSSKALAARSGALVYNVTINRRAGAPAAPFYCNAYASHWGVCMLANPSDGSCVEWYSYDLQREVLATAVTASQYSCSVRLNYNFPKGDSGDYVWPSVEVYQRSSASTASYPSSSAYSWRSLAPVLLPGNGVITTFSVSIDQ